MYTLYENKATPGHPVGRARPLHLGSPLCPNHGATGVGTAPAPAGRRGAQAEGPGRPIRFQHDHDPPSHDGVGTVGLGRGNPGAGYGGPSPHGGGCPHRGLQLDRFHDGGRRSSPNRMDTDPHRSRKRAGTAVAGAEVRGGSGDPPASAHARWQTGMFDGQPPACRSGPGSRARGVGRSVPLRGSAAPLRFQAVLCGRGGEIPPEPKLRTCRFRQGLPDGGLCPAADLRQK